MMFLDAHAAAFSDLLNAFSLNQVVSMPTRTSGNTLDFFLIRDNSDFYITSVESEFFPIILLFQLVQQGKIIYFRKLKSIDEDLFKSELLQVMNNNMTFDDLDDLGPENDEQLKELLDTFAAMKSKKVANEIRWFNSDALKLKMQTRNPERHWVKHKTDENWSMFRRIRDVYQKHLSTSKSIFIRDKINSCGRDAKLLFETVAGLTGRCKSSTLYTRGDIRQITCK